MSYYHLNYIYNEPRQVGTYYKMAPNLDWFQGWWLFNFLDLSKVHGFTFQIVHFVCNVVIMLLFKIIIISIAFQKK